MRIRIPSRFAIIAVVSRLLQKTRANRNPLPMSVTPPYSVEDSIGFAVHELQYDAVGLWQLVIIGKGTFHLTGPQLDQFLEKHVLALLEAGARAVGDDEPSAAKPPSSIQPLRGTLIWPVLSRFAPDPHVAVRQIIDEWKTDDRSARLNGIWFALPKIYETTTGRVGRGK